MIRGVKASEVEACAKKEEAAIEGDNADNMVSNDADLGATDLSDDSAKVENVAGTRSMTKEYCYFTEIMNTFCSWDEIKDYYYTPTRTDVPSDNDNASSEDLSQV